jgi:hypothetical protein
MMLLEWAVDQLPRRILSSLAPTIVEATALPSQITNVEIADEEFEVGPINFLDTLQDDYILGEVSANDVEMSIEKVQPTSISKGLHTQLISEGLDCESTPMLFGSISQSQPFPFNCRLKLYAPNYLLGLNNYSTLFGMLFKCK